MCQQIASGLAELAANGVVHRDVASRNILVHRVYPIHVKVCDFGLARREPDLPTAAPVRLPLRYATFLKSATNASWYSAGIASCCQR
jgi:serine/threonine protein kinase